MSPEAAEGGPIALVHEGDQIAIDINGNTLNVLVSDEELARRKAEWKPRKPKITTGYLVRYAKLVSRHEGRGSQLILRRVTKSHKTRDAESEMTLRLFI